MAKSNSEKQLLSMAGEYGVCSKLSAKGFVCSIVYGNAKAIDIFITNPQNPNKYKSIEVKTSRNNDIVTNFFQKYNTPTQTPQPDYWILVHIDKSEVFHFYVFTHQELACEQMKRNKMTSWHSVNGCDKLRVRDISNYENQWSKIKI